MLRIKTHKILTAHVCHYAVASLRACVYTDAMAKKPVRQFRFTQEADANLIRLAASLDLTRTQVLEMLINRTAAMDLPGERASVDSRMLDEIMETDGGDTLIVKSRQPGKPPKPSRFQSFPKPPRK